MALGDELADEKGRTSVKLTYQAPGAPDEDDEDEEDEEEEGGEPVTTVLCSLTPGKVCNRSYTILMQMRDSLSHIKIEQTTIDLILEEDQEVLFESVGKK